MGNFMTVEKKREKKKPGSGDEAQHMCIIFALLGPAQILFLIKSIIHFN